MDKKTLRRIIEEEKAQYRRNKKILKEHKKLAAQRKDFESLFIAAGKALSISWLKLAP